MPYNRYDVINKYNRRGRRFNQRTWVTPVLLVGMPVIMIAIAVFGIVYPIKSAIDDRPVVEETKASKTTEEDILTDDMLLLIVNEKYPLDKDYVPKLEKVDDVQVASAIYTDLKNMIAAANKDGVKLTVTAGYVSYAQQEKLFADTEEEMKKIHKPIKAESEAEKICPKAGNSESQTGLLITFSTNEEGEFSLTEAGKWLTKYCVNYGFVLRYPEGKESETGRKADDATYRYVGVDHAKTMRSRCMYFEEYVKHINQR